MTNGLAGLGYTLLLATGSGVVWDFFRWLNNVTSGITGPQATLIVGCLGLLCNYGPKLLLWLFRKGNSMRKRLIDAFTRYFEGRATDEDKGLLARWAAWFRGLKK